MVATTTANGNALGMLKNLDTVQAVSFPLIRLTAPLPADKWQLGKNNQNSRSENANPRLTTTAAIKTLSIAYSAMVIA
jgi:hypothetical protein